MAHASRFAREIGHVQRPLDLAALRRAGVGRKALRGSSWRKVSHGLYAPAIEAVSVTQRIVDVATPLPVWAAIGGWAAAYALGVDQLDGTDPRTGEQQSVDAVGAHLKRTSTTQVQYHRSPLSEAEITEQNGIRVTTPVRTALDGARWASSLEEAVAFVDAMVASHLVSIDELTAAVHQRRLGRGARQVHRAVELAEAGVRSSWESRLRMCYRLEAGLPRPYVNVPIFSMTEDFLGVADLFDPIAGLVTEFDGEQHRERRHHHDDNIREEGFEGVNLSVVRTDSLDLNSITTPDRRALVRRLRNGHRRGSGRDLDRDRWTMLVPDFWRGRIPGCDV